VPQKAMGDVQDILGLAGRKGLTIDSTKKAPKQQKPQGMSREIFSLIGNAGLPPLMPSSKSKVYKQKRGVKVSQWKWQAFDNNARTDNLHLQHWVKAHLQTKSYAFERFNKPVFVVKYTESEYASLLADDPKWSKEQTDKLIDICEQVGLRWPVIHDRYPANESRSVEDLKQRFYVIARKVLQARGPSSESETDDNVAYRRALSQYTYNVEYEVKRKAALDAAMRRTAAEEREEMEALSELRRIDFQLKKMVRQ
jgi:DNA methyltransferase 1-associated protein 1